MFDGRYIGEWGVAAAALLVLFAAVIVLARC